MRKRRKKKEREWKDEGALKNLELKLQKRKYMYIHACLYVCVFIKTNYMYISLHFALCIQMVSRYNLSSENISHCFRRYPEPLTYVYIMR